jgi:hypothetical protein
MADALGDLAIVPVTSSDTNYFLRKVTGLKIDKIYSFKFQWVLEDGTVSDWSPGYQIVTPTESIPTAPSAVVPATSVGNIPVTLSEFPANAKRVDIYVIGGIYLSGKVVDSFLSAGTKTISISQPGEYTVTLISVTPSGINGTPTNSFTITVSANSVDTTVTPGAPTSVIVTGFNEPSDPLNRTGYVNISFTAGSSAKGHTIGLWTSNPGSTDPVKVITADGTSTKIDGLFVGSTYYFKVRSFNQFNNTSSWVAPVANYPVTIPGTALVPGAVTISGTAAPKSIVVSWGDPSSNASLVTNGGYYEVNLYNNSSATAPAIETRKAWSNQASFSGLTTGTSYWVTVKPYTAGNTPVAGTISSVYGPLIPTAIDNPDLKGDFILASNQLQVGSTSGANDIHLSAYAKTVDSLSTAGRIYIGGPETSGSVAVGLYNNSGTPFYADNLGRFSLGDKLTWSGNLATPALNIKGTIDVTGPSTFSSYVLSGATSSSFVGIGYQVPYRLSSTLQTGANGLTGLVINSSGTVANSDYIKSDGTFRLAAGNLTFSGGVLAVTGNITANAIAVNTDISGATGTFTGPLSVGTTILANITGASSVTVNSITRVRFVAENALKANDSVTISGIAQNQVFAYWANPPTNTIPVYNYFNNPFNLGTVIVYEAGSNYFDIQSGVTGTYTSGGTATGTAFRVSSTGLIRGAAGQIGGWVIDVTKLRSASGSISLDPITPQITIQGSGSYSGYNITLASPTGITAGSTFSVTPAGYLTSTSGSIAGWSIGTSAISKSTTYTDPVLGSTTLTTTLGSSGNITISLDTGSEYLKNSLLVVKNTFGETDIAPAYINMQAAAVAATSTPAGNMYMGISSISSNNYSIFWQGFAQSNGYSTFSWQWLNYQGAERTANIAGVKGFDTTSQNVRPLVIDTQGYQYLGEANYFSTTQTTTPSSGIGQNGDLYFSTA